MRAEGSLRAAVGWAFPTLVVWALLAALWNFGGAWQLARGLPPPGPTASTLAGLVLLAVAVGFGAAVRLLRPGAGPLIAQRASSSTP
jgi:hypothetical protein